VDGKEGKRRKNTKEEEAKDIEKQRDESEDEQSHKNNAKQRDKTKKR
jgi:hypothetical protein